MKATEGEYANGRDVFSGVEQGAVLISVVCPFEGALFLISLSWSLSRVLYRPG
jgi:hypothetical protein